MRHKAEYELYTGELVNVKKHLIGKNLEICYAGKLKENCFSLAAIHSFGNNSYAYNVYIPQEQRELMLPIGRLSIIQLDATKIKFIYIS